MATASSSQANRPRPAAARRRAARFAAVQALYQVELNGQRPEFVVNEFGEHRLAQLLESVDPDAPSPEVDQEWFRGLVTGAWAARARLDPEIEACLAPGWTLARCGFLLRACLRAGAYELADRYEVPKGAAINEYIEVARLFFAQPEIAFVNAVMDKLGRRLRQPEPETPAEAEAPPSEIEAPAS